jgi:hypothetical protein
MDLARGRADRAFPALMLRGPDRRPFPTAVGARGPRRELDQPAPHAGRGTRGALEDVACSSAP